jgi:hypothetical protein
MGARWYDPTVGRFMGVDPAVIQAGNIHSFNRYGYANNNPYKYVDPDGRNALLWYIPPLIIVGGIYATNPVVRAQMDRTAARAWEGLQSDARPWEGRLDGGPIFNESSESVGKDSSKSPVPGATPGRETKGRTTQWEKPGGMPEADKDFDDKGPKDVVDLPGGGRRGTLDDGRSINVRPGSKDGRPTLEIQNGKNRDKVRYNP